MTVLLTGATGFIGSNCIKPLIERKYKVFAVSHKMQPIQMDGVEWICMDLKNTHSIDLEMARLSPTHLLHLAWYTEPPLYWNSFENLEWLQSSLYLLNAFWKAGGARAVMSGTCAEYQTGHSACLESLTPCVPDTLYGTSKLSLFLLAQKLSNMSKGSFAWARFFHLYGPGDHPKKLVRSVISGLLDGQKIPCSNGEQVRDYLHVYDAAEAITALMDSECQGAVNIGSGKSMKIREILTKLGQKIGREDLIQLGSLPMNPQDPPLLIPSTRRINQEVRWKPKMDIEMGLDQTIGWFKNEIHYRH